MVETIMTILVNQELQAIDDQIKANKQVVDLASALANLQKNRDFRKVILEGYFKEEAVRLVMLKADPSMDTNAKQDAIVKQIDAIGALNSYFNIILQQGYIAEKQLADNEDERAALEAQEQVNGGA